MTDQARSGRRDVSSRSLGAFVLLTFGISWGIICPYIFAPDWMAATFGQIKFGHPFFFIATWAPAISAIVLVTVLTGWGGLKGFFARVGLWRLPFVWLVFILVAIPVVFLIGSLIKGGPVLAPLPEEGLGSAVVLLFIMLFLGPIEEFGWRGYAQPILQRLMSPLCAGALIGVFWGLWHLPVFFLSGMVFSDWNFLAFFVGNITLAILVTPIFNASGGSILWAMLFHWQLINPFWPDAQPYDTWILVAVVAVIIWWKHETMLSGKDAVTQVTWSG